MKLHGSMEDVTVPEVFTLTAPPLVTPRLLWESLIPTRGPPYLSLLTPIQKPLLLSVEQDRGTEKALRGLCTCIPGQGIAMSAHAPGCQFHIPLRANLEGPSPLFTPDSSKKWAYTRVKFEIPLGSLLCDPWEARCLVELSYSSKSHWFGC